MLSSLGRFTTRIFLVILIIFIYVIIDSFYFFGRNISSDMLMDMFVNYLHGTLVFVVFISPPLLSLCLLRRPSTWRVLLHVASVFYILWIDIVFFSALSPNLSRVHVIFLSVYSGAALVAGLPEAMAAGEWAILVYYTALVFWFSVTVISFVFMLIF
jgi:hypothetical protein